jgi:phosphate starvation-inducible protein PhoH and related proteins
LSPAPQNSGDALSPGGSPASEKLSFDDNKTLLEIVGPSGRNLHTLEREVGLRIHARGNELTLVGEAEPVELARTLLEQLYGLAKRGKALDTEDLIRAVRVLREDIGQSLREVFADTILVTSQAASVTPKGLAQKRYVEAIRESDMVFGIGPAGTGKTYLAMAMAVSALLQQRVKRIVLARPAVEAGEKLGFLPGDLVEKVNPYLRPLYDALNDMLDLRKAQQLMERGQVEVAPLAFMRGRTLNSSFVILDEAQNSTSEQMLMFLTRLGYDSKAVVTGDVTQVDLPGGATSGLVEARQLLEGIEGIAFCTFTELDVVRHPLVQKIIRAYEGRPRGGGPPAERRSGAVRRGALPPEGREPVDGDSGETRESEPS